MSKQIVPMGNNSLSETKESQEEKIIKLQQFQNSLLQKEPSQNEIKSNKYANNSRYIPISFLEMSLDEIFFGLWTTQNFHSRTVANEEVGSLELSYFHPIAQLWITRVGVAAVQIQMRSKEKGGSGDITNISDKITNTLTKDYPHLKAECFRNACLSIGKAFGRDLNREFKDQYNPIVKDKNKDELKEKKKKIIDALNGYTGKDREDLKLECQQREAANDFTVKFANQIAEKLGIKI